MEMEHLEMEVEMDVELERTIEENRNHWTLGMGNPPTPA